MDLATSVSSPLNIVLADEFYKIIKSKFSVVEFLQSLWLKHNDSLNCDKCDKVTKINVPYIFLH